MKTCTLCNLRKPADEFYRKPEAPDRRMSRCIPCQRQYVAERRVPVAAWRKLVAEVEALRAQVAALRGDVTALQARGEQ